MVNFSYPPGILNGQPGVQPQFNMGQPVLSQNVQAKAPALTGNARMSSRMPMIPDNRIGLGEGMLRVGGAMMQGAGTGQGYSSAIDAYGNIMDYNRQADMERMQIEQARMLEDQRRQDLLRKMNAPKTEDEPEKADDTEIARLEGLLSDLRNDPNLTGPLAGSIGNKLDRSGLGDPKRAAKRLILSELQVNATLAYTAQTKGAITDREMALFQTPVPKLTDDEQVWISWLEPQLEVLKQLQQNGITDEAAKQQGITPSNSGSTPEPTIDDLVNQYDPQN
jgi:hypothetical protein